MKPSNCRLPIVFLLLAQIARSMTITSANTAGNGTGTLRTALAIAASGDTIKFSFTFPAAITLTTREGWEQQARNTEPAGSQRHVAVWMGSERIAWSGAGN